MSIGLMWPCASFGERLVYKSALEILGNKVNIRSIPGGQVLEQLSSPSIVIKGTHDEEYDYGDGWTPLVDINGYEDGVVASKYVREIPYLPFDSSFCGSYIGEGYAALEDYSYSLATITQKQGWYLLTITDYSQPNDFGLRNNITRIFVGRPIHENEYTDDDDRLNNFDGLYLSYELYAESDLDDLDEYGHPNNILSKLDNDYFIVTGPKELKSRYLKLTKN